jgi:nucleoside-diphosphate kinase
MIKPDGVQRGLVGEIIKRFEQKGYKLIAMKLTSPGKEHMEKHYADLSSKGFFAGLIEYMTSGPVVAMCWEGKGAVKEGRKMLGATMPSDSAVSVIICLSLFETFVFLRNGIITAHISLISMAL